ncbi:MAG TPA: ribonuclease HII [Terriglobia bacterium]|nr:ribonuclease HII [Terriglobia bacterium]
MPRLRDPKSLECTARLEFQVCSRGYACIAGCDEAGRGALIGPLYAAAAILDLKKPISGLDDSKKLAPDVRIELDQEIRAKAISFHVVAISAEQVDILNVYEASRRAMIRALRALVPSPEFIFTDAMPLPPGLKGCKFLAPHRALIHGDARSVSIAAASILAKVARDRHMRRLDHLYPQYNLAQNKGYATPEHLLSLQRYGPCREHRKTFQPVKEFHLPLFPLPSL